MRLFNSAVLVLAGGLIGFQATADSVDSAAVTTFESGAVLSSQDMNTTISALITAINDNATRIAELEGNAPTGSVAGRSYCVKEMETGFFMGKQTDPDTGEVQTILSGVELGTAIMGMTFVAGGTGTVTSYQDDFYSAPTFGDVEKGVPELGAESFTWTQAGNRLTLTVPSDPGNPDDVIRVGVINSGDVLLTGGVETETDEFGTGYFFNQIVAIEVDASATCQGIFSF